MSTIAIDGPAGAGKSTIAKVLSEKLGFMYVDTGAMYRTIAFACIEAGADLNDESQVSDICRNADIEIKYENGVQLSFLGGKDVSKTIREEKVGNGASAVSKFAAVRERLVKMQRALGEKYSVIMDGRDIGTVVLPDADLKIYLTASVDTRAKRRYDELLEKGVPADLEAIKKDIAQRDHNDMTREIAPLKQADDAVLVDSSFMTIDEVADEIMRLFREK